MADIDVVPKKTGTDWVLWVLAALAVIVVLWMLMGRNPDRMGLGVPYGSGSQAATARIHLVSSSVSERS
jgi:hypothetical protein